MINYYSDLLQSALQLTEVLKERDAQLEFRQLKEAAAQGKDRAYLEQQQRDLEEAIRRDQLEAQKHIEAAKKNTKFVKAQWVVVISVLPKLRVDRLGQVRIQHEQPLLEDNVNSNC